MTVLDSSGAIDFLLGVGVAPEVEQLFADEAELAAPDLLVFEVLAVLRRQALSDALDEGRAQNAVDDLGDLPLRLFPALPFRTRAWDLRGSLTAADALFVALAEELGEPLASKDAELVGGGTQACGRRGDHPPFRVEGIG